MHNWAIMIQIEIIDFCCHHMISVQTRQDRPQLQQWSGVCATHVHFLYRCRTRLYRALKNNIGIQGPNTCDYSEGVSEGHLQSTLISVEISRLNRFTGNYMQEILQKTSCINNCSENNQPCTYIVYNIHIDYT